MKIKVKDIDFGIAFRVGDIVYINKKIPKKSKLYNSILLHELSHTSQFNLQDLKTDLSGKYLDGVKTEYYKFLFKNPKAWYQFLPIIRIEKKWAIDPIMIVVWILLIIMVYLII